MRLAIWHVALITICFIFGCGGGSPDPSVNDPRLVVAAGNSLTAGQGAPAGRGYPEQLAQLLDHAKWNVRNEGVGGRSTAEMLASEQDALSLAPAVVVAWELGNSLYYHEMGTPRGQSESEAWNDYVAYCNNARAAGVAVVALTVTPRIAPTYATPDWTASIDRMNNRLRNEWAAFADGLADPASAPQLVDPSNTQYYADGVHLTEEGYKIVAGLVVPLIR